MNVEHALMAFGRAYGFGKVALDASGRARLAFENDLTVDLEYRAGKGLYLFGVVAALEPKQASPAFRYLLEANAPGKHAEDFVFYLDPQENQVVLSALMPEERMDPDALARVLERFLDTLEQWRKTIENTSRLETSGEASPSGSWSLPV